MPPQDQAHVKNVDLELMPMNLKEEDCYVINHGENLTAVDFDSYVSLIEKEDTGMARRADLARGRHSRMDEAEVIARQRKRGDLDGRKRRSDGYSRRSRRCFVSVALWNKMLVTSKEKVRSYRWLAEWRIDRARADYHRRSHDAVEQRQRIEGSRWARSREVGRAASTARVLQSTTRGCHEWRRAMPEDVLRAEEEERDHEMTISKGLSMGFLGLKEFWVSWFADLGRRVEDDGSECCDWLQWVAAAIGWRQLRGWSLGSLDLRGLPSLEEKSGRRR
ncbi:hypothetical protein BHM03_00060529 [Ensete ventricosum]|nr:hypothetical protein BHM03_00060529 [Ensete ventricosum]